MACNPTRVSVPDADHDRVPIITVHSVPSGPGKVSPGEVSITTNKPVGVTVGTVVIITADATNSGGVKSLRIWATQGGNTLWEVMTTGSLDAQNLAPKTLSILGSNGQGGIGGQPLLIVFDHLYQTASVMAEATNFNNQKTNPPLHVNYEALPDNLVE